MRDRAEAYLRTRWDAGDFRAMRPLSEALHRAPLTALSLLWRGGMGARNLLYSGGALPALRAPLPVISIGNLAVGGSGKTPVTAWLASRLEARGHRPGILLRGYGADETLLHRRWLPGIPVVADPDRLRGARSALAEGASVLLLDDGFQHRRLQREMDVVLLAAEHPLPLHTLPLGPYREGASALARADRILLVHRTAGPDRIRAWEDLCSLHSEATPVHRVRIGPLGWTDLAGERALPPADEVLATCSIARPSEFLALLRAEVPGAVTLRIWPDHHPYRADDVRRLAREAGGRGLVTTEKDAVKLLPFQSLLPEVRVLRIGVTGVTAEDALIDSVSETAAASGRGV